MTSQRKLEFNLLHADLAAVNDLLDRLSEEDVMSRMGLEERRQELKTLILAAEDEQEKATATATLLFGGKPVTGMQGIESKFGTSAVAIFQDLVAMIVAQKSGTLSPTRRGSQQGVVDALHYKSCPGLCRIYSRGNSTTGQLDRHSSDRSNERSNGIARSIWCIR